MVSVGQAMSEMASTPWVNILWAGTCHWPHSVTVPYEPRERLVFRLHVAGAVQSSHVAAEATMTEENVAAACVGGPPVELPMSLTKAGACRSDPVLTLDFHIGYAPEPMQSQALAPSDPRPSAPLPDYPPQPILDVEQPVPDAGKVTTMSRFADPTVMGFNINSLLAALPIWRTLPEPAWLRAAFQAKDTETNLTWALAGYQANSQKFAANQEFDKSMCDEEIEVAATLYDQMSAMDLSGLNADGLNTIAAIMELLRHSKDTGGLLHGPLNMRQFMKSREFRLFTQEFAEDPFGDRPASQPFLLPVNAEGHFLSARECSYVADLHSGVRRLLQALFPPTMSSQSVQRVPLAAPDLRQENIDLVQRFRNRTKCPTKDVYPTNVRLHLFADHHTMSRLELEYIGDASMAVNVDMFFLAGEDVSYWLNATCGSVYCVSGLTNCERCRWKFCLALRQQQQQPRRSRM